MTNKNDNWTSASKRGSSWLTLNIIFAVLVIGAVWVYAVGRQEQLAQRNGNPQAAVEVDGTETSIPVYWGDLGRRMVQAGVIDRENFLALYEPRGGLNDAELKLVDGTVSGELVVSQKNAGLLLNLLWALGLGNKNPVLEEGPMADPRYGDSGRFASTGGWTLAKGEAMSHYSRHEFLTLTPEQQELVERVAKNIYRPCCDNSTYFPDCNHGMAMLGLLELMASQGVSEKEMYRVALIMNSYWFPSQYATIARYLESQGLSPQAVAPREILGEEYSSASGFSRVAALAPREPERSGGGSCGV